MTVLTLRAGHEVAGRHLLQEPIGRGGMGVVRQAWDETPRQTVAVKCARPDGGRAAKRLKKEAQYATAEALTAAALKNIAERLPEETP
ncbi:hypothetical protein [Streptomyces sp. NPDC059010]|uniref:hypothetical protein n=1 Tax=Streptomyces sp. NPDC059010 TaxID=3346695 RepID=UPI0036AC95CF